MKYKHNAKHRKHKTDIFAITTTAH